MGAAGLLVVLSALIARRLDADRLLLDAAPLVGDWMPSLPTSLPATVGVVAGAVVVVAGAPVAIRSLPWPALLIGGWATAAVFAVGLAAVDGWDAVAAPLTSGFEYRAVLPEIEVVGGGTFVDSFVDRLPDYPTHVRGHPVGLPLVFWGQETLGLAGPGWSAAIVIGAGTSVVVSIGTMIRVVAGEAVARRAVPFLVLSPSVLWVATSADALIAGAVCAAVALFTVGVYRVDSWSPIAVVLGGAVAGGALHLSYGAVLMLLPMLVVAAVRVRWWSLVLAAVGAAAVTGLFLAAGFWWFDGLEATRVEYERGAGGFRPYWYFALLANPAALLLALGPAVVVALTRLRDRRVWIVVGGALAGVVLADLSGLSKGEVERIWLPFVPFLTAATVALPRRSWRWWLALQAGVTIVLQLVLESPW